MPIRSAKSRPAPNLAVAALAPFLLFAHHPALAENLEQAWEAAIGADQRLHAVRQQKDAAHSDLSAAEGARLPRLSLESAYTALDQEPAARVSLPLVPVNQIPQAEKDSLSYRATLSVPLYTGGRITRGIEAAEAGLEAADALVARAVADLKLEVARAYLDVLRAHRGVEVAQRSVASLEAHAADARGRFERGLAARNQLLAAQVALADARQRAIQARHRLDLAHAAYNRLLGRALTAPVALDEIEAQPLAADVEALTERALRQRAELSAATREAVALRHRSAAERAAAYPQVQFSFGQTYQENRYQVHEQLNFAALGLKWDLFDGGVIRSQAEATARRAEAVAAEQDDLRSRIALQVRQAWLDEQETESRIAVAREALAQAEENLKVARTRYREGLGTNTEVLDAETGRTLSYTNYHNAVYDAALADLRLRHALGEL